MQVLDRDSILYRVVVDAKTGEVLVRQSMTAFDNNDAQIWPLFPSQLVAPTAGQLRHRPDLAGPVGRQRQPADRATTPTPTPTSTAPTGTRTGEQVVRNGGLAGNWTYPTTWYIQAGCPAFGCTWDSTDAASKAVNRNAGAVGLFYLVNHFHDAPAGRAHRLRRGLGQLRARQLQRPGSGQRCGAGRGAGLQRHEQRQLLHPC